MTARLSAGGVHKIYQFIKENAAPALPLFVLCSSSTSRIRTTKRCCVLDSAWRRSAWRIALDDRHRFLAAGSGANPRN